MMLVLAPMFMIFGMIVLWPICAMQDHFDWSEETTDRVQKTVVGTLIGVLWVFGFFHGWFK